MKEEPVEMINAFIKFEWKQLNQYLKVGMFH